MTFSVRLLQVKDGQLGVVLERGEGLVTEELFDVVHVRAGSDELGCAAPPEGVRTDGLVDLGALGRQAEDAPEDLITQPFAAMDEERTLSRVVQQE